MAVCREKKSKSLKFYLVDELHPASVFAYVVGVLGLVFCYRDIFYLAVALGVQGGLLCYYRGKGLSKGMLWISLFFLLINPLTNHRGRTILCYLWNQPITLEALLYGLMNMLQLLNLLFAFQLLNRFLPERKLLFLFGRICPRTVFVVSLSLRFFQYFGEMAHQMRRVWKTRPPLSKNPLQVAGHSLVFFTAWALEQGMETAVVLKAKQYGTVPRTSYLSYSWDGRSKFFLGAVCLLFLGNAGVRFLGIGSYNPFEAIAPASPWGLLPMMIFLCLPWMLETVLGKGKVIS